MSKQRVLPIVGGVVALTVLIVVFTSPNFRFWRPQLQGIAVDVTVINTPVTMNLDSDHPFTYQRVPPILDLKILDTSGGELSLAEMTIEAERISWKQAVATCQNTTDGQPGYYDVELDLGVDRQTREIGLYRFIRLQGPKRLLISFAPSRNSEIGSAEFLLTIEMSSSNRRKIALKPVIINFNKLPDSCERPRRLPGIDSDG